MNTQGQQSGWALTPLQGPLDPSILGNIREQDEADSQVEKAAFSGLGGNVGRFLALP